MSAPWGRHPQGWAPHKDGHPLGTGIPRNWHPQGDGHPTGAGTPRDVHPRGWATPRDRHPIGAGSPKPVPRGPPPRAAMPTRCPLAAELRTLQAELGALQAGQAAELGQLERALALAQAERAAATAEAGQQAEEVARLRDEVAGLRAELRRGQELRAQDQLEATALRADARLKEQRHRCATAEVARLQGTGAWQRGGRGGMVAMVRWDGGHGMTE
ncbi:coiled-coil domain-containing protein 136 [Morphnus guianensis]